MTAAWHNDWRRLRPAPADLPPEGAVSAIVPCYQAPEALRLTLAGLERQAWPSERLEVIVVDDGSDPPLRAPRDTALDLRLLRQPRRGFGLARARNAGARAARHDTLLFLDSDIIAEAGLVAAHARWHQAAGDALTLGFCACVDVDGISAGDIRAAAGSVGELFAGRPFDPPWNQRHMARTGDLTSRHPDLFRAVTGHNFAISRALFEYAGGFDESFTRYGGEDTEFAYRAQVRGALLVPVREAFGWHQGRWNDGRENKNRDLRLQRAKIAERIAEPGFRGEAPEHAHAVPRRVVTLEAARASVGEVKRAVEALLADPAGDCVIRVAAGGGRDADSARLREALPARPNVRMATPGRCALDDFPASPIHVRMPAGTGFRAGLVARLEAALGDAAAAEVAGSGVRIARAWSLNRARRHGGTAADYGEVRTLPGRLLKRRPRPRALRFRGRGGGVPGRGAAGGSGALARIAAELRHVRGPRTAWRFCRWLAAGIRWRLRQGLGRRPAADSGRSAAGAEVDAPAGAEIGVLGPRSRAVFAASARVLARAPGGGERRLDAILADSRSEAAGGRAPCAWLDEHPQLAVPAFDPAIDNPIGWVRDVEPRVLALGRPSALPPGSRARRAVGLEERGALRHCHHVEDCAAFHPGVEQRAGALARLAARGVPVRLTDADPDPALERLLGSELGRLMRADVARCGAAGRETLSIALRRAALREHSLAARARQVCQAAGTAAPDAPLVSVLLATRRPELLGHAVASVARQDYPRLELVLALHGAGFGGGRVRAALAGFPHRVRVLRADAAQPLGRVLASAARAAAGDLLAKMDDDDAYGREHLWDLALAQAYSGAALVGKFPAVAYLAREGRTARARWVPDEVWSGSITGGAMLIQRAALERAGGWRAQPRHVDSALVEDVLRSGGSVYRTHHQGYVLVRHGGRHTWRRPDAEFLADAESVSPGWPAKLPGMEDVPPPPLSRAHGASRPKANGPEAGGPEAGGPEACGPETRL